MESECSFFVNKEGKSKLISTIIFNNYYKDLLAVPETNVIFQAENILLRLLQQRIVSKQDSVTVKTLIDSVLQQEEFLNQLGLMVKCLGKTQ